MPTLTRKGKSQTPQSQRPTATSGPTTTAGRPSGGRGGVQGVNLIILILVAASVTIAAGLLAKTVNTARSIDGKAKSISSTGGTINDVHRRDRAARPDEQDRALDPQDGHAARRGPDEDRQHRGRDQQRRRRRSTASRPRSRSTAGTINTTASSINGSATSINSVATEINTTAKTIDGVARRDQRHRRSDQLDGQDDQHDRRPGRRHPRDRADHRQRRRTQIITSLNTTLGIAQSIKVDSGNILVVSDRILDTAGCIDNKLPGPNKPPNSCQGKP